MRLIRHIAAAGFAGVALIATLIAFEVTAAAPAWGQSAKLPIPTGVCDTANALVIAADTHNITCHSQVSKVAYYTATVTPASVAANVCAEQTFTVTGLTTSDVVFINPVATGNATSAGQARVSAANTIAITYCNPTAGGLTPGAGTLKVIAFTAS